MGASQSAGGPKGDGEPVLRSGAIVGVVEERDGQAHLNLVVVVVYVPPGFGVEEADYAPPPSGAVVTVVANVVHPSARVVAAKRPAKRSGGNAEVENVLES